MQRRTLGTNSMSSQSAPSISSSLNRKKKKGGGMGAVWVLIFLAFGLLALSSWILFPQQVQEYEHEAEQEVKYMAKKMVDVEHHLEDWLESNQGMANRAYAGQRTTEEANARMEAQSSTWVDGEKQLKQKLKELQKLQKEGKLLGVPVLTRWLGEDFPAWVEPGQSEDEWRAKVDAKYAEMRKEEEQWQKKMKAYIKEHERDIGITTA
jgi:uncharacterized protein HemX